MTEIVTIDEFLMLLGAVGGSRAVLPDFFGAFTASAAQSGGGNFGAPDSSGAPRSAAREADFSGAFQLAAREPDSSGLCHAHRVLAGLLERGLLVEREGRAVPGIFALNYFTVFKNASWVLNSWPKEPDFPQLCGYLGYAVPDGFGGRADGGELLAALLGGVVTQPGAVRIELVTLKVLQQRFLEWIFGSSSTRAHMQEKEMSFDGYFAAPAFLMALPETRWIVDLCPVNCLEPGEHVKRRLLLKKGGPFPIIYQESRREWSAGEAPGAFIKYFERLTAL